MRFRTDIYHLAYIERIYNLYKVFVMKTLFIMFVFLLQGKSFYVPAGDLAFSVLLYSIFAVICLGILIFRHYVFPKGELGGAGWFKYLCAAVMVVMWLLYIIISSLQVRGHIKSPF